jgi:LL-diaminopimelate aminotransferase
MNQPTNYPTNRLTSNYFATLNYKVKELQAQGADIIRLDIGSPDLPPAPHIIAALQESALEPGHHGYQPHHGSAELRSAWAKMYRRVHRVKIDPKNVVPLLGSKEGVFHLSQAILNPGDVVLIPDPGYMTYAQGARFAQAEIFTVPLLPENNYLPDLEAIPPEIRQRAKLFWLNYPNNPTTAIATLDFFESVVDFARKNEIIICHDGAYTQVTFDGHPAPSILEIPGAAEVAIELNTLSKSHNMAGWRVGAAVGNPDILAALLKLKTHTDSGHFKPVLAAAIAAMLGDQTWVADRNEVYRHRRDLIVAALNEIGWHPEIPKATIYVWAPIPANWTSSDDLVLALLEDGHVSLTPGTVFGVAWDQYVRISLCQPIERIRDALERIKTILVAG